MWLPAPCWASRWVRLGSCCSNNRFRAGFGNATARVLAASGCPRCLGCWLLRSCWIACGVAGSLDGSVSGLRYFPLAALVKRLANTRKPAQWGVERAFAWLPKCQARAAKETCRARQRGDSPSRLLRDRLLDGFEAGGQVGDNVVDVLGADGQAHGGGLDAGGQQLLFGQLGVRGGSRVDDQGLHVSNVGQQAE